MIEKVAPTKGPWRVVTPSRTTQNRHDACIEVLTDDYQKAICHVYERRRGQRMPATANGWLLAAAPDLLEACEAAHVQMIALGNLLNWDGVPQEYADAINKAREAIAKAKGEEG